MVELLPHHATKFTKALYEKGPKGLAEYLANDDSHKQALIRTLADIMKHRQDEPITLTTGQNDILCKNCPGRSGPYHLPGLGKHVKCDLTTVGALESEQRAKERIKELTGKENPTVREIYNASCKEWKAFKNGR